MNTRLLILTALFFGTICTASAQSGNGGKTPKAGKEKADKKKEPHRELNPYEIGKLPGTVYVFGFSQEFGDTIAYITDITKIDSLMLQKKTGFLPFRYDFSQQLKNHLEGEKGLKKQTPCVFFSKNKIKLSKKLSKMRKRYLGMEHTTVVNIGQEEFKFVHPLDVK
ncbi:MAG: hypothetical protein J5663_06565 [Bacteroidaceae bacterium]|nr:hypothetical protein [Bacteroidaceae bacterium]